MPTITETQVAAWVAQYVHAWETGEAADIRALFTEDAQWHEWPYETHWVGLDEIVEGIGAYVKLGNFKNLWVVTLADDGRASVFRHWNNEV